MTPISWTEPTPVAPDGGALSFETIAEPCGASPGGDAPWVLFVGGETRQRVRAALAELGPPAVAPPRDVPLVIAAHRLAAPELSGARALYLAELDRSLHRALGTAGSSTYLLAKIAAVASNGEPLSIVATADARGATDLMAQRGLASRFEIRRIAPDAGEPYEPPALPRVDSTDALGQLFLAAELIGKENVRDAVQALKQAVALDPSLPAAHYELGKALIQADALDGAVIAFRRTVELLPEFASAWGNLGAALGELQKLDEAVEAIARAVALDPASHALHSNLGAVYRDLGRLDDAEAEFRTTVALQPAFVFGHYNLAGVLYLQERYRDAIASFEHARSLDDSRSARQSLMLATARLASGDVDGAHRDYRDTFARLEGQMKLDMRTVAEWDLKELSRRVGVSQELRDAATLLRSL